MTRLSENDRLISLIATVIGNVRKKTHADPARLAHKHETVDALGYDRTVAILIEQVTEPIPNAA